MSSPHVDGALRPGQRGEPTAAKKIHEAVLERVAMQAIELTTETSKLLNQSVSIIMYVSCQK